QFVMRYATAVHAYFDALLGDPHDAEDAFQKFCLRVVEKGFAGADPERGRFRDYLQKAVRDFALNFRRDRLQAAAEMQLDRVAAAATWPDEEGRWLAEWQRCLLDRAWRALEVQQAGDHFYAVLRLAADYPDETSEQLAQRLSEQCRQPFRAHAFRKQLS